MWGTAFAAAGVSVAVILDIMGLTQPLSLTPGLAIAAVCGAIGAGVATSTLRLARRAKEPIARN
jgi:hypothetical protein